MKHLKLYGYCGNTSSNQVEALIRSGAEAIQELLSNPNLHCLELY
jgi:predicted nuclease of predicted toxin-antitoxin system